MNKIYLLACFFSALLISNQSFSQKKEEHRIIPLLIINSGKITPEGKPVFKKIDLLVGNGVAVAGDRNDGYRLYVKLYNPKANKDHHFTLTLSKNFKDGEKIMSALKSGKYVLAMKRDKKNHTQILFLERSSLDDKFFPKDGGEHRCFDWHHVLDLREIEKEEECQSILTRGLKSIFTLKSKL